MKLFLSKLLPLFTAAVILLCSVFALVPIESYAIYDAPFVLPTTDYTASSLSTFGLLVFASPSANYYYGGSASNMIMVLVDTGSSWESFCFSLGSSSYFYYYNSSSSNPSRYQTINQHVYNSSESVYFVNLSWGQAGKTLIANLPELDSSSAAFDFAYQFYFAPAPTPTPEPTPSPTPSGPTALPFDQYFRPFRSFTGLYYDAEQIAFPESMTSAHYQQYSGIVSNHDLVVTDCRSNLDFYDDKVVYKFEYDIWPKETDSYDLKFCYDADNEFGYVYVYYTVSGIDYDGISFGQQSITGTYTVYGAYDIDPTTIAGPPYYHWDVALDSQRNVSLNGVNFNANSPVTVSVIVASSTLPHIPSTFDWSQFFQDTRPDNVFLATTGGLAALPFFVSGLSFLALGALIGIVLKFMR